MSGLESNELLLAQAQPAAEPNSEITRNKLSTEATAALDTGKNDGWLTKTARVGTVTGEGLLYSLPGVGNAIADDWHHKMNFVSKLAGGAVVGTVMKTILPESGVGRAIAGTLMLGYMAVDVAKPFVHAGNVAWNTNNADKLDAAAKGLGDGLGKFAWDSTIGMAGGAIGETLTGSALKVSMTPEGYKAFEASKVKFWNSPEGKAGKYLVPLSEKMDSWSGSVKQKLNPREVVRRLQGKEALDAVGEASEHVNKLLLGKPLYKSAEFSQFIDSLVGDGPPVPIKIVNIDPDKGFLQVQMLFKRDAINNSQFLKAADATNTPGVDPADGEVKIKVPPVDHAPQVDDQSVTPDAHASKGEGDKGKPVETKPTGTTDKTTGTTDGAKQPADSQAPAGDQKAGDSTRPSGNPVRKTTPAEEFSAANLKKAAQVAATEQEKWANTKEEDEKGLPNQAQIADFRDSVKGPVTAVKGNERLIATQYDQGLKDVVNLTDQIDGPGPLQQAGPILQFHSQAAAQVLLRNPDTIDLNNLSMELHSIFLQGLRDIGITKLDGKVPSWVAVTYDQESGNFTIAAIKNVMSLPVTVFPRSQTKLLAVFGPINGHEMLGHDYIYPELARFPKEFRTSVLAKAVQAAFKNNNIADTDISLGSTPLKVAGDHAVTGEAQATGAGPDVQADVAKETLAGGSDALKGANAPGETKMKKSDFFIKMLEAEANENTADMMGTAATGTGTPISLGVLLQSLRVGGLLETRNVFGKQFPNLVEPHGFDRWRVKLCAETIRHLSDKDPRAMEIAKALDTYADSASRAGDDYVLASMDNKGETIRIPQAEWDSVIPEIVKAQFETGLPSFRVPQSKAPAGYVDKTVRTTEGEPKGYVDMTLKDVVGKHFLENLLKTDELATQMADAVSNGKPGLDNFDATAFKQKYGVNNIFNASLLAWVRATARGEDPEASLEAVSKISADLRSLYRTGDNPHIAPLEMPAVKQFLNSPVETTKNGILATIGNVVGSQDRVRSWIDKRSSLLTGAGGALLAQDLLNHYKLAHQLVTQHEQSLALPDSNPVRATLDFTPESQQRL